MKKILFIVAAVAAIFVFNSCKDSNGPSTVAEKSMECLKNKDFKGYTDLLYFDAETLKNPEKVEQEKAAFRSLLEKSFKQKTNGKGDIKSYSVVSEENKDTVAVVKMAVVSTTDEKDTIDVKLRKDPNGEWKLDSKK